MKVGGTGGHGEGNGTVGDWFGKWRLWGLGLGVRKRVQDDLGVFIIKRF